MQGRLEILVRAGLRLTAVELSLRWFGVGSTQCWLLSRPTLPPVAGEPAVWAADLTWVVAAVARWSPLRPACLSRSLTLWSLLREAGIRSRVCLGARQGPAGLLAHAWVELDGRVLNDNPSVARRFTPLGPARSRATR
ncbi:MAG TPA: lasso peptide biosynthesis B2 protein [Lamprocystis sp. (in: g-proteobacteria)]|nr:lasso peptide biosynthesis B2 protein [Lamprocystis sp. (in: g-proteobacteria)]